MPDVQVRITTTGAEQAVQAFDKIAQASNQFSQTTMSTVTQARIATQGFGFALLEVARLARLAGPAGKEFAGSLETGFVAIMATRGAVAAYRGVLESQLLITKLLTEANLALAASWGLGLAAAAAIVVGLVILIKNHRDAVRAADEHRTAIDGLTASGRLAMLRFSELNDRLRESILLQQMTAGTTEGLTLTTKGLLGPSTSLHETFRDVNFELKQMAEREKEVATAAHEFQKIPNYFREIGAAATDIERPVSTLSKTQSDAFDKMEADLKKMAEDIQATADAYGDFVPSTQQASNAVKNLQIQFEDGLKSMLTVTAQGTDLFSQLWTAAINQVIAKLLEMQALKQAVGWLSGFFGGILGIFGLQHGGSFIATRPTPLMLGESGAERVTVSPLAGAPVTGGGGGATFILSNVVMDENGWAKFMKEIQRRLGAGPVSRVG